MSDHESEIYIHSTSVYSTMCHPRIKSMSTWELRMSNGRDVDQGFKDGGVGGRF